MSARPTGRGNILQGYIAVILYRSLAVLARRTWEIYVGIVQFTQLHSTTQ